MGPPPDLKWAPDRQVVAAALEGRETACWELVRRYQRLIYAIIHRIVGTHERAEDLTQETFAKTFNVLHRYSPDRPFAPWIAKIARNTALDYVRHRPLDSVSSPYAVTPGKIGASVIWGPTPTDTPSPDPEKRQRAQAVEQALARLRPEHRACIMLHILEQRTYGEIASILDLPLGTVATYIHRGRKRLRQMLAPLLDSSEADAACTPS